MSNAQCLIELSITKHKNSEGDTYGLVVILLRLQSKEKSHNIVRPDHQRIKDQTTRQCQKGDGEELNTNTQIHLADIISNRDDNGLVQNIERIKTFINILQHRVGFIKIMLTVRDYSNDSKPA
jgi:hypothetical protein